MTIQNLFVAAAHPVRRFSSAAAVRFMLAGLALSIAGGLSVVGQEANSLPVVRIGTALDGPGDTQLLAQVQAEVVDLLESRFAVQFPEDRQLMAEWSSEQVTRNIDSLFADSELDAIVVLGFAGPAYLGTRTALPKPTVAAMVIDPETQGMPLVVQERALAGGSRVERFRVSGVPNLNYLSFNLDLGRELDAYRELIPFTRLAFLTERALGGTRLSEFQTKVANQFGERGVQTTFLTVGESPAAALDALPMDAEAVILGGLPHLSDSEFEALVEGLLARKIPSFSLVGQRDVRRGVLAGLRRERNEQRLVRRLAINLFNIILGEEAAEIPVDFQLDEQLTINMSTARALGVDPSYTILTEAELVAEVSPPPSRRLSLPAVLREAQGVNLDLLASGRQVAAGLESVAEARSNLLPQVQVSGMSSFLDGNNSIRSQSITSGSIGFSQLIYSENARASFDIERHQQNSREEARSRLRLDVLADSAVSYLEVLRAKTVERIQKNNLKLTRSNLELAQSRLDLGAGGREEVLRWQNQIAVDRRRVIDAGSSLGQAEIAVNTLLNRPLSERFGTVEAGLDDPELTLNFQRLGPYIESPGRFEVFRDFMTTYAWDTSPELRQLDANIRAGERALLATRRESYIPVISVDAQARTLKSAGSAFSGLDPGSLDWLLGATATLPLFQGGGLRARRSRAQIELDELRLTRNATRLVVGQRIQTALFQAGASFAGISLANDAVTAARENLQLVRDRYSEGQVDIVRLLDAQTQALAAELEGANAVFSHLTDLMRVQRAAGRFDYFRSAADRNTFVQTLAEFYKSKGIEVRNP